MHDFDRAVEANPQSLIAVRAKAEALVREGRAKDAVAFLEATVSRDPTTAGLHGLLAALHVSLRQPDKAAASFRKAAEVDPRALEPRLGLARLTMSQGNDKEAVAQLQAAVKD
ncbi:MAG TPA: tetratricopeptide repeat protein, partial [Candidatus Limnocylindrales bacterium]|nr:tetratricopeptide repeat protein [Candidatus Limnocylindrales bacterium]